MTGILCLEKNGTHIQAHVLALQTPTWTYRFSRKSALNMLTKENGRLVMAPINKVIDLAPNPSKKPRQTGRSKILIPSRLCQAVLCVGKIWRLLRIARRKPTQHLLKKNMHYITRLAIFWFEGSLFMIFDEDCLWNYKLLHSSVIHAC